MRMRDVGQAERSPSGRREGTCDFGEEECESVPVAVRMGRGRSPDSTARWATDASPGGGADPRGDWRFEFLEMAVG